MRKAILTVTWHRPGLPYEPSRSVRRIAAESPRGLTPVHSANCSQGTKNSGIRSRDRLRGVFWRECEVYSSRRFEFKEGSSNRFWEIELTDKTVTVCFGEEKSTEYPWPQIAEKEHAKLIAERLRKGYKEIGAADTGPEGAPSAKSVAKSAKDLLSAVEQYEPLKRVAKQLKSLQRLSLRITTEEVKRNRVGADRLGGRPDLPPGLSRPIGKVAGREIALPFIAQFDAGWLWRSYMGRGDTMGLLPTRGMLYFFYNMENYGADYLADSAPGAESPRRVSLLIYRPTS